MKKRPLQPWARSWVLSACVAWGCLQTLTPAHAAWNAGNDERNRQRTMAQIRANTAQFEVNQSRMMSNMQRDWDRNRAGAHAQSQTSGSHSSYGGSAPPAYDALGQLGSTLQALQKRSGGAGGGTGTLRTQQKAETDADVLQRFKESASAGNSGASAVAATWVGKMLYSGFGAPKNDVEAFRWFKQAAEQGEPEAMYHTGYLLHQGLGTVLNEKAAAQWFEKSAAAGNARGQLSYASALMTGKGLAKDEARAAGILQSFVAQNLQLSQDADLREGQALAAGLLGDFYRSGTGVKADLTEAVRWYSLAAERGDRFAARDLAKMYYVGVKTEGTQGASITPDPRKGLAWLVKAAEIGHSEAQANVGLLMVQGKGAPDGLPKDVATGVSLVQEAAQKNEGFAWMLLGDFRQDRILPSALPFNPKEALAAYRKAVELGYKEARYSITPALLRVSLLEMTHPAFEQDLKAAQGGDGASQLRVADRYADGLGVTSDLPKALEWYQKSAANQAAPASAATAQGMAGLLLLTGQAGVKDEDRGMALMRKSAQGGDSYGMVTLGELHEMGMLQPLTAARTWYEKAAAAGNVQAQRKLEVQ